MSRLILSSLLVIATTFLFGQKIEAFCGPTSNLFFAIQDKGSHFQSRYVKDYGYSAGLAADRIVLDKLKFRFTIQFDHSKGSMDVSNGGLGGFNGINAQVSKSMISLGIFPLTFDIQKKLHLNFGLLVSKLIVESVKGYSYSYFMGKETIGPIELSYDRYNADLTLGMQGRIAYDIQLTPTTLLTPQYVFHYGLTNEFKQFPRETRLLKHYFCLGISKGFW